MLLVAKATMTAVATFITATTDLAVALVTKGTIIKQQFVNSCYLWIGTKVSAFQTRRRLEGWAWTWYRFIN